MESKYICTSCIIDEYLVGIVESSATETTCNYCEKTFEEPACCEISIVVQEVKNAIEAHYTLLEEVPRMDGDYIYEGESTAEIARDLSMDFLSTDADDILVMDDIEEILGHDEFWVDRKKWPGNGPEEELWLWENFKKLVQYKNRYFFGVESLSRAGSSLIYSSSSPMELLESLCGRLQLDECLALLDEGTKVYRVRKHKQGLKKTDLKEFCAPPPEDCVQANRMSPPGIQVFYGALDHKTAKLEVNTTAPYYLAEFQVSRPTILIDLTLKLERISMFDPESAWWNNYVDFMNGFISDLTRSIDHSTKIHIEYIPTQVVSEYFRHIAKDLNPQGFIYPSHQNPDGRNVAFFGNPVIELAENSETSKFHDNPGDEFLNFVRVRRIWT